MRILKIILVGVLLSIATYYLRLYMKGATCDLVDRIDDQHVLITGANTGLGLETAVELASRGGVIHMACRDSHKCESAKEEVLRRSKVYKDQVITHTLDLGSLKSILAFSLSFKRTVTKLDVLINNAGIYIGPYRETDEGFESHIGVNHLGHFLLTKELLGVLKSSERSRIVIVSAALHELGTVDTTDINLRGQKYGSLAAYAGSKLANVLHAKALSRRLRESGVAVVSLHPGVVTTELLRDLPGWTQMIFRWMELLFIKSPKEGAQTQICCAVNPNLMAHTGAYFSDCKPISSWNTEVYNETLSEWLWHYSETLIESKIADFA